MQHIRKNNMIYKHVGSHQIDVVGKFRAFIFVDRMADIGIGSLHGDFSGSCRESGLCLRP